MSFIKNRPPVAQEPTNIKRAYTPSRVAGWAASPSLPEVQGGGKGVLLPSSIEPKGGSAGSPRWPAKSKVFLKPN
eukprot:6471727-Amphidinium_carterae.3